MTEQRERYDGTFKEKVVLEAIKGQKTIAELSSHYRVYLRQIGYLKVFAEDRPIGWKRGQSINVQR